MKKIIFKNFDGEKFIFESKSKDLFELENAETLKKELFKSEEKSLTSKKSDPKDIQRLIRAGYSVDDISKKLSISKAIVERFSLPIVAEISFVVEKAKRVVIKESTTILDIVNSKLYKSDDITWSAVKPNHTWIIKIEWSDESGNKIVAEFSLDNSLKILTPTNVVAENLIGSNNKEKNVADILYGGDDGLLEDLNEVRGKREVEDDIAEKYQEKSDTNNPIYTNLTEALKKAKPKNNVVDFKPSDDEHNDSTDKELSDDNTEALTDDNNKKDTTENEKNDESFKEKNDSPKEETDKQVKKSDDKDSKESEGTIGEKSNKTSDDDKNTTGSIKRTSVPSWDDIVFGSDDD